jgi:hypothetical protein
MRHLLALADRPGEQGGFVVGSLSCGIKSASDQEAENDYDQ